MRMRRAIGSLLLLALVAAAPRRAPIPRPQMFGPPRPATGFDLCDEAIAAVQNRAIPATLLPAIARVESGRLDPVIGRARPWPWTINVEGVGSFYDTKADVIAAVQAHQARGVRSIDVGCMQVNLMYHPAAFADLETAFDPAANAAYAAQYLTNLFAMTKNWYLATAMYHSAEQDRGEDYQRRVFGQVMALMGPATGRPGKPGSWPPPGVVFGALPPASLSYGAFPPPQTIFGAFAVMLPPGLPDRGQRQATTRR